MRRARRGVGLSLLAAALALSGCGPGKHPTAPVDGLVTHKGKALTRGRVIFMHPSGPFAHGDIGPDGRYSLRAPVGECQVAVTCREAPPPHRKEPGIYVSKSLIPEHYEDHMKSKLTFDVQQSANTADWKLE